jgi:hypothetical protein
MNVNFSDLFITFRINQQFEMIWTWECSQSVQVCFDAIGCYLDLRL